MQINLKPCLNMLEMCKEHYADPGRGGGGNFIYYVEWAEMSTVTSGFKLKILPSHLGVQWHLVIAHAVFNNGILTYASTFVVSEK